MCISNQTYTSGYLIKLAIITACCVSAKKSCKYYVQRKIDRKSARLSNDIVDVKKVYSSKSFVVNDFMEKMEEYSVRRDKINAYIQPSELDFGYSETNPIGTSSIESSEKYLSLLRNKEGQRFYWIRQGSVCVNSFEQVDNVMVDIYHLYLNGVYFKDIYICPYAHNTWEVPIGFVLAETDEREFLGSIYHEAIQKNVSMATVMEQLEDESKHDKIEKKEELCDKHIGEIQNIVELNTDDRATSTSDSCSTLKIMFCRKCGAKLYDDCEFCHRCGAEVIKECKNDM